MAADVRVIAGAVMLGAGAGAIVGMFAGGAIGRAIAEHSEFGAAGSSLGAGVRVQL